MTVKLGTPKYEQNNKNYFAFKKDQNTFILRVLPPMGELADAGKWSIYHRVEFGYKDTNGRMKPFLSPRVVNFKGMVEVESEAYKRRELVKDQAEQAKTAGNTALEQQCREKLRQYNQDAKHYMNVVDLQGNVGLFKIGHRGYQALKAEIDRLRSEGIDPIGIENGRFFVFARSGKNRDTIYTVKEYKQKQEITGADGQKVVADMPYPHKIGDAIMNKLATDAFELNKVYPSVTPEQEYRIVHEGPTAVEEILSGKSTAKAETATAQAAPAQAETAQAAPVTQAATEAAALAQQATAPAQAPVETAAPAATEAPAATAVTSEMSDEDFFKKVESGNF